MKRKFCRSPGTAWQESDGVGSRRKTFCSLFPEINPRIQSVLYPFSEMSFFFFDTVFQLIEVCVALLVMCNREKVLQVHIMEFNFIF